MAGKNELQRLTDLIKDFRDERGWLRFHNHKDMALSLALEAAEVLEHFQWKNPAEVERYGRTHKSEIADELADVAAYLFELADNLHIDLSQAIERKLVKNAVKYPSQRSGGRRTRRKARP